MSPQNRKDRGAWLQAPPVRCEGRARALKRRASERELKADRLTQRLGACHRSTGDIFRAAVSRAGREQTSAIREALGYRRRGALVPDSTVWEMVRERIACLPCGGGFILVRMLGLAECLKQLIDGEA